MECAQGIVALAVGLVAGAATAAQDPPAGAFEGEGRARHALLLPSLTQRDQGSVRRALDLALAKLAFPGCSRVYADFKLPQGGTPQDALDRMGIGPEELLERLVFTDGSRDPVCGSGRAVLTTTAGRTVIRVCPGFSELCTQDPERAATLMIHESLHALGLGEGPPTSNEITNRVDRRCWKPAKRSAPVAASRRLGAAGEDPLGERRRASSWP
jgi:hypothetical protein